MRLRSKLSSRIISTLLLALLLIGWVAWQRYYHAPPIPTGSQSSHSARQTADASFDHIVIIVEENKPSSQIIGNPAAPYINKLASDYSLATNYFAVAHPSLPNYLALTSGTTAGITNDCNPPSASCQALVKNIVDEIERSGRTWKFYGESMPNPCGMLNSGDYAVKHNPFVYYPAIRDDAKRCAQHDVPFSQFADDLKSVGTLPDYVFISPNLCNDMHNCPVATGDAWLARYAPQILQSPAFTTQRSLLVITWDEGDNLDNHIPAIFAGSAAKKGYQSNTVYTHYSLLHTIEQVWKLAPLTNNDKTAPVMTDMLR